MCKQVFMVFLVLGIGIHLALAQDISASSDCASAVIPSGLSISASDLSAPASDPANAEIMNDIGINPQVLLNVAANFGDIPIARADFANPNANLVPTENAVVTSTGDHMKMYAGECTASAAVAQLSAGTHVRVLEGPYASEGLAWWHIQHQGLIGWVIEGQDNQIWLRGVQ